VPGVRLFTLRVGTFRFAELFEFRTLLFTAEFLFEGPLELLLFLFALFLLLLFALLLFALLMFAFLAELEFLFLFLFRSDLLSLPEVSSSLFLSSAAP